MSLVPSSSGADASELDCCCEEVSPETEALSSFPPQAARQLISIAAARINAASLFFILFSFFLFYIQLFTAPMVIPVTKYF